MQSLDARLKALEQRNTVPLAVHPMRIGETEEDARGRIGIAAGVEVFFVQRVIVRVGGSHANC
ncbi:hypothetical protein [Variovorax saccharolyticus]|uniref:hypothetical protein n=1 Tax=Variovorax saccharolyticus TaxID=3053516 RepID=UPI002577DCBE|nr:hypothetical protein [Variovorax sp. J31P216]MDM0025927.1 hypothetical protein [Variovorax sp. J31P216]